MKNNSGGELKPSEMEKGKLITFSSNCVSSIPIAYPATIEDGAEMIHGGKWILRYSPDTPPDKEWEIIKSLLKNGLLYSGELLAPSVTFNHYTITFDVYDSRDISVMLKTYDIIKQSRLDENAQDNDSMEYKTNTQSVQDGSDAKGRLYSPDDIKTLRDQSAGKISNKSAQLKLQS